jgi:hypothetical protein
MQNQSGEKKIQINIKFFVLEYASKCHFYVILKTFLTTKYIQLIKKPIFLFWFVNVFVLASWFEKIYGEDGIMIKLLNILDLI